TRCYRDWSSDVSLPISLRRSASVHGLEQIVLERPHILRIRTLAERRKAGEVGEQHGNRTAIGLGALAGRRGGRPARGGHRLDRRSEERRVGEGGWAEGW